MPSLNLTKEDVNKQLADLRESLVASVDRRITEIKADVEMVTKVRSEGVPFHADAAISTVHDFVLHEKDWRCIDSIEFGLSGLSGWGSYQNVIQSIELPAGRYRVFIQVHKVPE